MAKLGTSIFRDIESKGVDVAMVDGHVVRPTWRPVSIKQKVESRQNGSVILINDVNVADINVFGIYVPKYECKILIPGRVMLQGSCKRMAVSILWVCFVVAMHRLAAKHITQLLQIWISDNIRREETMLRKLLSQCTALHFSQCTLEPYEAQHCTGKEILQWRQNDCCLELKSHFVQRVTGMDGEAGKAQADSDG